MFVLLLYIIVYFYLSCRDPGRRLRARGRLHACRRFCELCVLRILQDMTFYALQKAHRDRFMQGGGSRTAKYAKHRAHKIWYTRAYVCTRIRMHVQVCVKLHAQRIRILCLYTYTYNTTFRYVLGGTGWRTESIDHGRVFVSCMVIGLHLCLHDFASCAPYPLSTAPWIPLDAWSTCNQKLSPTFASTRNRASPLPLPARTLLRCRRGCVCVLTQLSMLYLPFYHV